MRFNWSCVLTVAVFVLTAFAEEYDVVDADPFRHEQASDERQEMQHAFSAAGSSDHVILKACSHGETRTVSDILRHDADLVNHANHMGWSCLTFAAANGHHDLLFTLLQAGAEPNHQEHDGWTPLMFAAFHGDEDSTYALLDHGANPLIRNERELTAHELCRLQGHENLSNFLGSQSIFFAMRERNLLDMLFHLEQGINPNVQNGAGWTPLIASIDQGNIEVMANLIRMGANVNFVEHDGWSPLMFAAFRGDAEMARLLLQEGADVTAEARNRQSVKTAYEMAREGGHEAVLQVLHEYYVEHQIPFPGVESEVQHSHIAEEETHERREQVEEEVHKEVKSQTASSNNKKKRGGTGFFNW